MWSMVHRRTVLVKVGAGRFTRTGGKGHKVRKQDGSRMVLVKVGTRMFTRTAWGGTHDAQADGSSEGVGTKVH